LNIKNLNSVISIEAHTLMSSHLFFRAPPDHQLADLLGVLSGT
jgi:hypothetical protein